VPRAVPLAPAMIRALLVISMAVVGLGFLPFALMILGFAVT
jgi:hypothetical protein